MSNVTIRKINGRCYAAELNGERLCWAPSVAQLLERLAADFIDEIEEATA